MLMVGIFDKKKTDRNRHIVAMSRTFFCLISTNTDNKSQKYESKLGY